MTVCATCNNSVAMQFACKFCGKDFCAEHSLPENHDCENLPNIKSPSITYLPKSSEGFFPKTFKIRKQFDAEELARSNLSETYENIKGYDKFESKREDNDWVIEGIIKTGKLIGTKRFSFKIVIDAVSGKIKENNQQPK